MGDDTIQVRGILLEKIVISTTLDPYLSLRSLASYSGLSVRTLRALIDRLPAEALALLPAQHREGLGTAQ
jgi:hypothetical protein